MSLLASAIIMHTSDNRKMLLYQLTVLFSVVFSLMGFSYNVWRMEVSEQNNTIRTASFEILINLASLEQLVYAAHYDQDSDKGNPRTGWVIVGLIQDLSVLTDERVMSAAKLLQQVWGENWKLMQYERTSADAVVVAIDKQRAEIQRLLNQLE